MATARHPKATYFVQRQLFAGLTSFAELESKIAALPDEQSRGAAFEVFAEAYLATQRKHDAAQVWPHGSVPLDLLKNLGLTQQDQGVDGVLQTLLGQFNAYQIKFRTGRPALTWRELSTFIGLADSPHIHSRVLLTNCDELPAVLNDRQGFFCIRGSDLDRLEAGDFRAMEAWLADAAYIAPKKSPQPHQTEALDALLPALQTHDRVSAIMACGTGKTLVALWVAENVAQASSPAGFGGVSPPVGEHAPGRCVKPPPGTAAPRILILLPSLALLRQTLHEWLRETRLPSLAYLCVCSDPTVKEGIDALTTQQSDLDFQVSTDATSVRSFLDAPFAGVKMIFSTYQSASVVGAAMKPGETFDFAVFDEAHKTAGREGRNFAFALDDKNLSIRKRLFLTATPRHYNPLAKDKEGNAQLVFSMDRPDVYGSQAYRLTFAEAARRGIICNYKVIISVITSEMVTDELLSRGEVIVNGDAVRARQVANQLALKDAVVKYKLNKVFTFHSRIDAAASFASDGNEGISAHLPDFKTFHVNGDMPTNLRERVMTAFRACARGVMSNARCLTEGVDVPAVDMVAFLSPRRSKIDIVQATGRAMRTAPGKTMGFVLVPLYVEQASGEKIEEAIERTEFDEIWQVLQSLQEQDDVLAETISRMREDYGRGKGFNDAAFRGQVYVLGSKLCLEVLRSAITTKCVETLGSTWDERFGELKAFQLQTGHCLVSRTDVLWSSLGNWVGMQRQLKRAGKLSEDRVRRLKEIGFIWGKGIESGRHRKKWEVMFAELQSFKNKYGHCDVNSQPYGLDDLNRWIGDQHLKFRRGKLAAARLEKLQNLGVAFVPPEPLAIVSHRQWLQMFERLVAYKKEFGDCDVPKNYCGVEGLARWVVCQRNFRSSRKLKPDYIRRLNEVGFVWNRKDYHWHKMYSVICESMNSVSVSGLESSLQQNLELSKWVNGQQSAKKNGRLSRQKQSLLDKIGFPWKFPKKQNKFRQPKQSSKPNWEKTFLELCEFQKTHGHCDTKRVSPLNENLHKWTQKQRQAKRNGAITNEQIKQLDQIGFIWDTKDLLWERIFNVLVSYKSAHGDCNVPQFWQNELQLANWVWSQRKQRKKGELKPNQIERLDQIGFAWDVK
jgi:superfamily II DNA or RNA helicase